MTENENSQNVTDSEKETKNRLSIEQTINKRPYI